MKYIFCVPLIFSLYSLNAMEENNQPSINNISDKPTITACMQYYCCNPSDYCSGINAPEKMTKIGKCLLATGLVTKSTEFCCYTCCYPHSHVDYVCKTLWFPSCSDCCSSTSNCLGGSIDWPCTLSVFTGPVLWVAGAIWSKCKKEENLSL